VYVFGGGAFVDPAATSASSAESDGRVYSIISTGNAAAMSATWLSGAASIGPFRGTSAGGDSRFYQFLPGGSGVRVLRPIGVSAAGAVTASLVSPNGEFPTVPQFHFYDNTSNAVYLGYLREIYTTRAARLGQKWTNGLTTVGYILAPQTQADAQACVLMF
jgi:hypothetical protein